MEGSCITPAIRSCGTESVSSERNICLFITSTMAVVSCASKLLLGRVQGLSRVASSFKYATASTGKYADSNNEIKGGGNVALIHTMKTRRGVEVFRRFCKIAESDSIVMYVLLPVLPSAWNNSAPTRRIFMKLF